MSVAEPVAAPPDTISVPTSVVDLDSFRRWTWSDEYPERGRISFIDGEVSIDLSLQDIESHGRVKQTFFRTLGGLLSDRDEGELIPFPTSFVNDDAGVSHEPDAIVCLWETIESGRVVYFEPEAGSGRQLEVVGSPDIVVEVVSRSSVRKDTVLLPVLYFEAGVREYWLVDARRQEIAFDVLVRGERAFEPVPVDDEGYRPSAVLGAAFRLGRTRNRLGISRYALHVKE